jgi:hypothetical protein
MIVYHQSGEDETPPAHHVCLTMAWRRRRQNIRYIFSILELGKHSEFYFRPGIDFSELPD